MRFHQLQNKDLDYKFHLFNSDNIQTLLSINKILEMTANIRGENNENK